MQLAGADWPTFGWIDDIRPALRRAANEGRTVVLATLIRLEGPAPRPVGTQMLFDGADAVGYFSGGCLESDVANHAAAVLGDGEARHLVYGQGSPWIDVRLTCGGRIEILLERIDPRDRAVAHMLQLGEERQPAFWWSDGSDRIVDTSPVASSPVPDDRPACRLVYQPAWRLVVVGTDPIALAIAQLGTLSGFETILLRWDRAAEASPLEGVTCLHGSVATSFSTLGVDCWTAVVSVTHDDESDDQAMLRALGGGAGYAGVLGAARKVADRKARLLKAGLDNSQVEAMRAPIGLRGCGKAPFEVAVSVLAEIMQARFQRMQEPAWTKP